MFNKANFFKLESVVMFIVLLVVFFSIVTRFQNKRLIPEISFSLPTSSVRPTDKAIALNFTPSPATNIPTEKTESATITPTDTPVILTLPPTPSDTSTVPPSATHTPPPPTETLDVTNTPVIPTNTLISTTLVPTVDTTATVAVAQTATQQAIEKATQTAEAATPFPYLSAITLENCDGQFGPPHKEKDYTDTMCDSSNANPTPYTKNWKLRWQFNPTITLPNGWYYSLRFFKDDPITPLHTIHIEPTQIQSETIKETNWRYYTFNINDNLKNEVGCYPYWDVIVEIPHNLIQCDNTRKYGDICQLTDFPNPKRSLGTQVTCVGGIKGNSSQPGSTSRPTPPPN